MDNMEKEDDELRAAEGMFCGFSLGCLTWVILGVIIALFFKCC